MNKLVETLRGASTVAIVSHRDLIALREPQA